MRIPIAYCLSYPERIPNTLPSLDLFKVRDLNFYEPDLDRFQCLRLAKKALKLGGDAPCALNAANEVAVASFLEGKIAFLQIAQLVEAVLNEHRMKPTKSLEALLETDVWARERAGEWVRERNRNIGERRQEVGGGR